MCVSEPHLKTGNSEAPGVVRRRGHGHDEGAVGDVLVVEADRHLVVSCGTGEESVHRVHGNYSRCLCLKIKGQES